MTGSFLENQYEKSDSPFELGPLARKIKHLTKVFPKKGTEEIKKQAQEIVNNITNPFEQMRQQAMNSYALGMMNSYGSNYPPISFSQPKQFEATNEEIAETLAELEYDDISDIVDRAYQIKSMKQNKLPPRYNTSKLRE